MVGIPMQLLNDLRNILLTCNEFKSAELLQAIFLSGDLVYYRNSLPIANNPAEQVDVTIAYLATLYQDDGKNILALFIEVLGHRYNSADARHGQLLKLANKLKAILEYRALVHQTRKIQSLFLAANPKDTNYLRIDKEIREINKALRQTEFGEMFEIRQEFAVRVDELQGHLLRYQPDIVHFSGHSNTTSAIILENKLGVSHPVPPRALSNLFAILKDNIKCVVLSACYSQEQAEAIAQHIDYVIGMTNAITDEAAISFAASFYQGLGFGRSVRTAYDLGKSQIALEGLGEEDTPRLLTTNATTEELLFIKIQK